MKNLIWLYLREQYTGLGVADVAVMRTCLEEFMRERAENNEVSNSAIDA